MKHVTATGQGSATTDVQPTSACRDDQIHPQHPNHRNQVRYRTSALELPSDFSPSFDDIRVLRCKRDDDENDGYHTILSNEENAIFCHILVNAWLTSYLKALSQEERRAICERALGFGNRRVVERLEEREDVDSTNAADEPSNEKPPQSGQIEKHQIRRKEKPRQRWIQLSRLASIDLLQEAFDALVDACSPETIRRMTSREDSSKASATSFWETREVADAPNLVYAARKNAARLSNKQLTAIANTEKGPPDQFMRREASPLTAADAPSPVLRSEASNKTALSARITKIPEPDEDKKRMEIQRKAAPEVSTVAASPSDDPLIANKRDEEVGAAPDHDANKKEGKQSVLKAATGASTTPVVRISTCEKKAETPADSRRTAKLEGAEADEPAGIGSVPSKRKAAICDSTTCEKKRTCHESRRAGASLATGETKQATATSDLPNGDKEGKTSCQRLHRAADFREPQPTAGGAITTSKLVEEATTWIGRLEKRAIDLDTKRESIRTRRPLSKRAKDTANARTTEFTNRQADKDPSKTSQMEPPDKESLVARDTSDKRHTGGRRSPFLDLNAISKRQETLLKQLAKKTLPHVSKRNHGVDVSNSSEREVESPQGPELQRKQLEKPKDEAGELVVLRHLYGGSGPRDSPKQQPASKNATKEEPKDSACTKQPSDRSSRQASMTPQQVEDGDMVDALKRPAPIKTACPESSKTNSKGEVCGSTKQSSASPAAKDAEDPKPQHVFPTKGAAAPATLVKKKLQKFATKTRQLKVQLELTIEDADEIHAVCGEADQHESDGQALKAPAASFGAQKDATEPKDFRQDCQAKPSVSTQMRRKAVNKDSEITQESSAAAGQVCGERPARKRQRTILNDSKSKPKCVHGREEQPRAMMVRWMHQKESSMQIQDAQLADSKAHLRHRPEGAPASASDSLSKTLVPLAPKKDTDSESEKPVEPAQQPQQAPKAQAQGALPDSKQQVVAATTRCQQNHGPFVQMAPNGSFIPKAQIMQQTVMRRQMLCQMMTQAAQQCGQQNQPAAPIAINGYQQQVVVRAPPMMQFHPAVLQQSAKALADRGIRLNNAATNQQGNPVGPAVRETLQPQQNQEAMEHLLLIREQADLMQRKLREISQHAELAASTPAQQSSVGSSSAATGREPQIQQVPLPPQMQQQLPARSTSLPRQQPGAVYRSYPAQDILLPDQYEIRDVDIICGSKSGQAHPGNVSLKQALEALSDHYEAQELGARRELVLDFLLKSLFGNSGALFVEGTMVAGRLRWKLLSHSNARQRVADKLERMKEKSQCTF